MKHLFRIIALLIVLVIVLVGLGYDVPFISDLPIFGKPEDAVTDYLKQDNLMELLSRIEEGMTSGEIESEDPSGKYILEIFNSSYMKNLFLDNVRSISYNITNVSKNGDNASVTTMIRYLDLSPVLDRTFELLYDKLMEMDSNGSTLPETEGEQLELFFSVFQKSFKEAVAKTKPSESYRNVKFDCVKSSVWTWELKEVPDDISQIIFLNFYTAYENASNEYFNS